MTTSFLPINPASAQERCITQPQEIGDETMVWRCLDWDRDRFDILSLGRITVQLTTVWSKVRKRHRSDGVPRPLDYLQHC